MKGKNKYIVPLLLAGITSTAGIVTTVNQQQQTLVQAETTAETVMAGAGLSMKSGFDDIYQLDDDITMPEVTVTGLDAGSYELKYTITRGSKTVATLGAGEVFEPTYTGAYNVTIEAVADNVVVSKIEGLTIMVEKSDAVITLPTNSKYVIPAKIPTSQTNFKIPAPEVELVDDNGEEVEMPANGEVKVKLVTPSETVELTKTEHATDPYYAVESADLADAGTYQIRYEYYEGDSLITRLESNFQVVEDLDMSDTKLYMKLQSSVPTTGNVNTDISVPKVTVLDDATATDGINAHLTITYSRILDNGTYSDPIEIDYDTYTFCPQEEGNYILSYKADLQELYGISTDVYKPSTIIKVTDNQAPTVRPTYDYDVVYDEETQEYTIQTKDGEEVTEDNSSELLASRKCDSL